jgi:hypothetical protein
MLLLELSMCVQTTAMFCLSWSLESKYGFEKTASWLEKPLRLFGPDLLYEGVLHERIFSVVDAAGL